MAHTKDQIATPPTPPRKVGRPRGLGKVPGSGRKTGQKNWTSTEIRDALLGKSNAIEVLADIVAGRPLLVGTERASSETGPGSPVWRYPTLNQRLKGLEVLLAKVVPDLKAVEAVVDAKVRQENVPQYSTRQTARAILNILGRDVLTTESTPPSDSDRAIDSEACISPKKIEEDV